jgi:uncharacterized membrane protein YphA (DoxX/SURF4 family)
MMNILLWIFQFLLALLFLFAGVTKLVLPLSALEAPGGPHLPGLFLRFIGVCELLGGVGLLFPSLLRIRPSLTPLAAVLLAIIMVGAVVFTVTSGPAVMAITPFVTLVLLLFIAYGRTTLAPISPR